jgi:hypothetical protein
MSFPRYSIAAQELPREETLLTIILIVHHPVNSCLLVSIHHDHSIFTSDRRQLSTSTTDHSLRLTTTYIYY